MSTKQKLLALLLAKSAGLTWNEAVSIMKAHHFDLLKGDGSSRKFVHRTTKVKVFIHRPHPGNIVKAYAQQDLIDGLKNAGEIP